VAIAQAAAVGDERIKVTPLAQNRGPGPTRNAALERCRGDWVAVFDSDDLMAPTRLQRLLDHAQRTGADIVADNQLLMSPDKTVPFIRASEAGRLSWISLADFIASNCLYSKIPSLGYLKPVIRRICIGELRYSEVLRNGEDYDLLARIMGRGARLSLLPEPLYSYRIHAASVSQTYTEEDLLRLLAAHEALAAELAAAPDAVHRALARRRDTLRSTLAYTRIINDLKGGRRRRGVIAALSQPRVWPLLTRPLKARARRLAKALRGAATPRPTPAGLPAGATYGD
jgi:succinoglycan biosynthesis protein ExoO